MPEPGKHTLGPWEYGSASNFGGFYIAPRGTLPTLGSVERMGSTCAIMVYNFPGNTEANARLISAAPDLLEALEAAEKRLKIYVTRPAKSEVLRQIRAAISKARGVTEGEPKQ